MTRSNDIYGLYCTCSDCGGDHTIKYVGQTIEGARSRFNKHRYSARTGAEWPVSRWMRKHGIDNIRYRIIEVVETPEELDDAETRWISELRTSEHGVGYNLWPGGGAVRGYKHSPSAKSRQKGPRHSEETREKLRVAASQFYGESSGNHKLTSEQVMEIRAGWVAGLTLRELSKTYGTSKANISGIISLKSWTHLPAVLGPRKESPTGLFERGEVPPNTKLNPEKVREIRRLGEQGLHPREIAERYGVTPENISMILKRKTWKHVE